MNINSNKDMFIAGFKIEKVILSCETVHQLDVAEAMINNFDRMWPEQWQSAGYSIFGCYTTAGLISKNLTERASDQFTKIILKNGESK